MRASYDSIDNKLKQKMCGKVNKDITFIQFFHSTSLYSTELFKIFFSLLTLQLLFCKKRVGREKMASEYYQRVFASQPIRTRASKLFSCYGGLPFLWRVYITCSTMYIIFIKMVSL